MSDKAAKLIEDVKALTVLELPELVRTLEEESGVSVAAPVAIAAVLAVAVAPAAEERTEFDVVLEAAGANEIQVIKAVHEAIGLGLKEAKEFVDGAPENVKEGASKDDAKAIKAKLTEADAEVGVK